MSFQHRAAAWCYLILSYIRSLTAGRTKTMIPATRREYINNC